MSCSKMGSVLLPIVQPNIRIRANGAGNVAMTSIPKFPKFSHAPLAYQFGQVLPRVRARARAAFVSKLLSKNNDNNDPQCPGLSMLCGIYSSFDEFVDRVKQLPSHFQTLLTQLKSKVKGGMFEVMAFKCHGTITIVVQGPGIDGVFLASDGLGWVEKDGKNRPCYYDVEKVLKVNEKVLGAIGGNLGFPTRIIKNLQSLDLSANDCALYAQDYMANNNSLLRLMTPLFSLTSTLSVFERIDLFRQLLWSWYKGFEKFYMVFASANDEGTTIAIYSGRERKALVGNPMENVIVRGMCEGLVGPVLTKALAVGIPAEDAIVIALYRGYKHSREDEEEKIGGRFIIKQINSAGIISIFDGDIMEMLHKYGLPRRD